jgi:hypothetical protein
MELLKVCTPGRNQNSRLADEGEMGVFLDTAIQSAASNKLGSGGGDRRAGPGLNARDPVFLPRF